MLNLKEVIMMSIILINLNYNLFDDNQLVSILLLIKKFFLKNMCSIIEK